MMTLDVLISTIYPEGIERVACMELPTVPGVRYVVSWQKPRGYHIPESLASRDDVAVFPTESIGVARNRNNAIRHATADLLLIADDDLKYPPGIFDTIRGLFQNDNSLDFAIFKHQSDSTDKIYPDKELDISLPLPVKYWFVTEFEICVRRDRLDNRATFDEEFGLGCDYIGAGEGDIFLFRLVRALKLHGRFFPITIAYHHGPTTGIELSQPSKVIRSRAVFRRLLYPRSWWLRILVDSWRDHKSGRANFFRSFKAMTEGARYATANLNPDGSRKKPIE